MPSDDPKFERALAQNLRGGSAQANCPDAETLAAYHERNLSLEEMAQWKEHIAACEVCQEALALVETTENQLAADWQERGVPVLEAASMQRLDAARSLELSGKAEASTAPQPAGTTITINRRRPALLRWAIPLGAVAAGVLVFIGIYEQRSPKVARETDTVIARRQEPATPAPMFDEKDSKVQPQVEPKEERAPAAAPARPKKEQELSAAPSAQVAQPNKNAGDLERGSRDQFADGRLESKKSAPKPAPRIPMQAATGAMVSENAPVISAAPAPRLLPPSSLMEAARENRWVAGRRAPIQKLLLPRRNKSGKSQSNRRPRRWTQPPTA
jgi:hypothetical protein